MAASPTAALNTKPPAPFKGKFQMPVNPYADDADEKDDGGDDDYWSG